MPYITKQTRDTIRSSGRPVGAGELCYAVTKLCQDYLVSQGASFRTFSEIHSALLLAWESHFAPKLAIYEESKRNLNGDVI